MKHGKKPTRAEKKLMAEWGMNAENWLVVKRTPDFLLVCHRHSEKTTREIPLTGKGREDEAEWEEP